MTVQVSHPRFWFSRKTAIPLNSNTVSSYGRYSDVQIRWEIAYGCKNQTDSNLGMGYQKLTARKRSQADCRKTADSCQNSSRSRRLDEVKLTETFTETPRLLAKLIRMLRCDVTFDEVIIKTTHNEDDANFHET